MEKVANSLSFRYRALVGGMILVPPVFLILFSAPHQESASLRLIFNGLGWIFFCLYLTFRIWSILFIGGKKNRILVTEGPYSITRNPLYFGSFCFSLSAACFFSSAIFLFATLLATYFYLYHVIPDEERLLERAYGESYRSYKSVTPKFIPSLKHYHSPQEISVSIPFLLLEVKHLCLGSLMPLLANLILDLKAINFFPHFFNLP